MLDPAKMLALIAQSNAMTQSSQSSLTAPFLSGAGSSAGGGEMQQVMSSVANANNQVLEGMNNVFASMQQNVDAKQAYQQSQRPPDFTKGTDDLRKTVQLGFPQEDLSWFSRVPRS